MFHVSEAIVFTIPNFTIIGCYKASTSWRLILDCFTNIKKNTGDSEPKLTSIFHVTTGDFFLWGSRRHQETASCIEASA